EGGNVDESRDFGMPARLSDHHAAVRVTDQDRRTYLLIEDQIGRGHVALQRNGRILDDADVETVLLEDVVEASPARAVNEGAVNQNDVVDPSHGCAPGRPSPGPEAMPLTRAWPFNNGVRLARVPRRDADAPDWTPIGLGP